MSQENQESNTPKTADALGETPSTPTSPVKKKNPFRLVALSVIAIAGLAYGFRTWQYNSVHASTDDAFLTSDLVPVNSTISGSVKKVYVSDNQHVNVGDMLVELDSDSRQADVDQAEANLAAAKAAAGGADADVQLAEQTGYAQVSQAQQAVTLSASDIAVAQANAVKAASNVATARANIDKAGSDIQAANAIVDARKSTARRSREQLTSLKAQITSAQASLKAAQANLVSAQAIASNANRDAERATSLKEEGATAAATADARQTAATTAKASVEAARQQVDAAKALVAQRQADLATAQEAVKEADAGVVQAQAQLASVVNSKKASEAQAVEASSSLTAAKEAVSAASIRRAQSQAKLLETQASLKKVNISQNSRESALAKIKQAAAALETARINLDSTKIRSLVSGTVSMKTVQIGQQLAPGQEMMAIIPVEEPWIVANFKETQLAEIRPGLPVEIEVDALPGYSFKGRVDSIARGTGSTFALLPPDNATGNFTKVVQRVPVKIVLDEDQPNLDKLRAGLSTKVSVSLRG
ncbi:MAG: HlyD family efflux transporter periplasmic adaptor subunit [Armatimonadetes bacterium]|nr:HlyD family efflux transporter periplasmic adaptor subunit [Armatimonadota bacterium]MBS1727646.1 HlyD family secretion protein [Armatimonadota bacterium]